MVNIKSFPGNETPSLVPNAVIGLLLLKRGFEGEFGFGVRDYLTHWSAHLESDYHLGYGRMHENVCPIYLDTIGYCLGMVGTYWESSGLHKHQL